ncbi:hypothetical protein DEO72_LG11g3054 [Vigna unguiculata]|uniref:F-box domain-containing protein n=2 Tax=Vigna unguiculata TaxID=3917 RepID=A0A4D6NSX7_VIGUN|nr:hypothetical protein DEO72_LG11g3054 [Vigna unguiculata]
MITKMNICGRKRKKTETGDGKREKMQTDFSPSPSVHVNEDLIKEILLNLPTKAVLRFKALSKSWFSLISDSEFARRHFDAAVSPTHKLLNFVNDSKAYCVDIKSALCNDSWHAVSNFIVPSSFDLWGSGLSVAGSCRGFLLLQYYFHDLVMWNPSTGRQKEIHCDSSWPHDLSGMGYDPVDDDIVVVTVTLRINDDNDSKVSYFSLRTNCWTSVEYVLPYAYSKFQLELRHGQFWNGALYWILKSSDKLRSVVIAFDVREKRLSEVPLPNHLAILPLQSDIYHLKVMGEHLFLCLVRNEVALIEMWSMKEQHKEVTFWIKTFVFSSYLVGFMSLIFPICFTENGEILAFNSHDTLLKINKKGNLVRYGKKHSLLDFLSCGMYRESFLSLPGESGEIK